MKIPDRIPPQAQADQIYRQQTQSAPVQQAGPVQSSLSPKPDAAAFSEDAVRLSQAVKTVKQAPDIRADVVSRIKTQIDQGTYQVSPAMLARSIASHVTRNPATPNTPESGAGADVQTPTPPAKLDSSSS